MSDKRAAKKTEFIKNGVQTYTKTKSKTVPENKSDARISKKVLSNLSKNSQNAKREEDVVTTMKLSQASIASRSTRTTSSERSLGSSEFKSIRHNPVPSTSKSTLVNASSHSRPKRNGASSVTKAENVSKSNVGATSKKGLSQERKRYMEKGGISTIYIPKSNKVNVKTSEASPNCATRDKMKLQDFPISDRTKSRVSTNERKKSRTLSPSEIKVLHNTIKTSDVTSSTERNKVAIGNRINAEENKDLLDCEDDYEDDFEDYESDFQECTDSETSPISEKSDNSGSYNDLEPIQLHSHEKKSNVLNCTENAKVEEECMLDSGHYDLAEARKRAARIESIFVNRSNTPPIPESKEPISNTRTHSNDRPAENKSLPSTDEGFEDSRSGDFTKSPPLSQISFIGFHRPKINLSEKKTSKMSRNRGKELSEMIKLDFMEWSILECSPIPYDEFIKNYGRSNTVQIFTQTGDDNMDVEIQTDQISQKNKWTQFPIACRKELRDKRDTSLFRMEQLGVGNDLDELDDINITSQPSYDVLQLNDFLNRAGTVMLSLLEERKHGGTVFQNNVYQADELPFSDGFIKLSVNSVTFLATRMVKIIHYSSVSNKILLTIHSPVEEEIETASKQYHITDCSVGCVWNISEPSMPKKLFYSQCPITACCFHLTNYSVVFAGLEDGSLSLWDLNEDEMWHQRITDKPNKLEWVVRTPTYTTAANTDLDAHTSRIVAIRVLSKIETILVKGRRNKFIPIQICSLDEDGYFTIWSIVHNLGINIDDLGLCYWGDVRLIKNYKTSLIKKDREIMSTFIDMHVDSVETNSIYVATNSTAVLHAYSNSSNGSTNPIIYKPDEINKCNGSTCMDVCPFGESFFMIGCADGTIRLHFSNVKRPIVQLRSDRHREKINVLQWSKTKPLIIYVLDDNSRIYIWDLSKSDIYPIYTLPMRKWGNISSMQLSPCTMCQDTTNQYLALGMESGNVEVHKLREEFCYSKEQEFLQERNVFLRYVSVS